MNTPTRQASAFPADGSCDYLGLEDDPQTCLAVPSLLNICHRAVPPEPVRPEYQRLFCQTPDHTRCPVFRADRPMRLPVEIRGPRTRRAPRLPAIILWLVTAAAVLATVVVVLLGRSPFPLALPPGADRNVRTYITSPLPTSPPATATALEVLPPIIPLASSTSVPQTPAGSSATVGPAPTSTSSSVPESTVTSSASARVSPTITASPVGQCGHQLEEAFGSAHRLLIHRVKGGESLNMFADRYYTTVDVIEAVNYDLYVPIRNESALVIAPGLRQDSVLPAFEAYEAPASGISPEALATQVAVQLQPLIQYNAFGTDCTRIVGWAVIPRALTATP